MTLTGKLPHELTHDDIMRASHYEGETLSNSISAVFAGYKVDQFIWAHKRIETERVDFAELITEYRTKYRPPWKTLREILSAMREATGSSTSTSPIPTTMYFIWAITNGSPSKPR